jgi:hypothetical protein
MSNSIEIKRPEWSHWSRRKTASLAEGILLSQNVCPNTYTMAADQGLGEAIDEDKWRLLEVCRDWVRHPETSWVISRGSFLVNSYEVEIDLPKFANWVFTEIRWIGLPQEFISLCGSSHSTNDRPLKKIDPLRNWKPKAIELAENYLKSYGLEGSGINKSLKEVCSYVAKELNDQGYMNLKGKPLQPDTVRSECLGGAWYSEMINQGKMFPQ